MRWWNEYTAANDPATLKGRAAVQHGDRASPDAPSSPPASSSGPTSTHTLLLAAAVTLYMVSQADRAHLLASGAHGDQCRRRRRLRQSAGLGAGAHLPRRRAPRRRHGRSQHRLLSVRRGCGDGDGAALQSSSGRKIRALYPNFASVRPRYEVAEWRARSFKLWISNGLEAANQYLDVLIIGYLMSPAIAGAYFVTTRLANAFATASDTMHMFSTRHIPDLYYRGEFRQLNSLLNSVAGITLAVVAVGMVVILGGGKFFLMVFNEAYVPYYPALAAALLRHGGCRGGWPLRLDPDAHRHEGRYLKIIALTVLIRAVGFFTLIPFFGIMGAVSATTISFIFMMAMLRYASKKLTGLDGSVHQAARACANIRPTRRRSSSQPTRFPAASNQCSFSAFAMTRNRSPG